MNLSIQQFSLEDRDVRTRYDRLFDSCPTAFIQQSSQWAEVIKDLGPDLSILLLCSGGGEELAGLPLYLFQQEAGAILTSVPQPGPLGGVFVRSSVARETEAEIYQCLLEAALRISAQQGVVALTIITNPFADDFSLYAKALRPRYVLENFTQYLTLTEPIRPAGGQRNNLARAKRYGFRVVSGQTARDLERWYALHAQRQAELGISPHEFRLYENIFRILVPRGQATFLMVVDGDRLAAAGLYIGHRDVVDVFAISMASEYAVHAPNALLTEASILWARDRGGRLYNWQSSPNRGSGVYTYKKLWGGQEARYCFVTATFPGLDALLALGPDAVKSRYPWHYVIPFDAFGAPPEARVFRKP